MLKIRRSANGQVVLALSGRMAEDDLADLEALINAEGRGRHVVLDLKQVTLVGGDAIALLIRCEAAGITLENCPAYVREWINRQRSGR